MLIVDDEPADPSRNAIGRIVRGVPRLPLSASKRLPVE